MTETLSPYAVDDVILTIRGHKVILDRDLAMLYGVEVKRLNEQVKRNQDRFPDDFAFRLTPQEVARLRLQDMRSQNGTSNSPGMRSQVATASAQRSRSQFATLKRGHNIKYRPYAFTEHGAIKAATVLNSSKEDPSALPACPEQRRGAASGTRQDEDRLRCPRGETKILAKDPFEGDKTSDSLENARRRKMLRPLFMKWRSR